MEMEAAGTFCSTWQSGPSLSCVSQIFPWSPGMGNGSGLFFDVSCSKNWKNFQNLHFHPTFSSISDAFIGHQQSLCVPFPSCNDANTRHMRLSPFFLQCCLLWLHHTVLQTKQKHKNNKRVNTPKRVLVILYDSKTPNNIFLKLSWYIQL